MRYWHTDMNKKRVWVTSDNKTPLAIINDYYHDKCYVRDADRCGDEKVYFVFSNGQKYVLKYKWYIGTRHDLQQCRPMRSFTNLHGHDSKLDWRGVTGSRW